MVLKTRRDTIKRQIGSKRRLLATTSLGVGFLVVPLVLFVIDPIIIIAKYQLRIAKNTILGDLIEKELMGPRLCVYLFNITNSKAFLSGEDTKLKVEEVGPFTYQEYRINDDLEMYPENNVMRYTPRLRTEFIPEESIGHPEDVQLTVLNIPMLAASDAIGKYPFWIQQLYNLLTVQMKSQPFLDISAEKYMWGYYDPLTNMGNKLAPGLIYFNSTGLLERLYDMDAKYRVELATHDDEKFRVRSVTRLKSTETPNIEDLVTSTLFFNNTYEGGGFPPQMTPEMPISLYRNALCKTFIVEYSEARTMNYGGTAFVYNFSNSTFHNENICYSNGECPDGLMDLSSCYYGLPFALSIGHFTATDPKLFEKIDGMSPDPIIHLNELVVDPRIGLTVDASLSLQLNVVIGNVKYNPAVRRLTDIVIPVSNIRVKQPKLPEEAIQSLRLMYVTGPYVLLTIEILCIIIGVYLLLYTARLLYWNWVSNRGIIFETPSAPSLHFKVEIPLLNK